MKHYYTGMPLGYTVMFCAIFVTIKGYCAYYNPSALKQLFIFYFFSYMINK